MQRFKGKTKDKVNDYSGSSEHLKKDLNIKKVVDVRLQIFVVILIALAGLLIYKAYQVQIVQADHFANLLEEYQTPPIYSQTMRGEMYDRNMRSLVSNKAKKAIRYYPAKNISDKEQWELAAKFAKQFNVKQDLNEYDQKVLWMRQNNNGLDLITDEEYAEYQKSEMTPSEFEAMIRDRVTPEHLATLTEQDKITFNMLVKMNNIQMGQSAFIMEDVSNEQIAYLSEHASEFPGFSYSTSWTREYNDKVQIRGLVGSVGDIQSEKLPYYLALGYQQSDKVGTFGLEYQYESLLSGIDSQYERNGNALKLDKEGRKGYDLKTALDTDLQAFIEDRLVKEIENARVEDRRRYFDQMHMVISDPNTGDILAIAAMKRNEDGTYWNDIQSTMLSIGAFPVGSSVKPGTVYMAQAEGVIDPYEQIADTPMYIQGTNPRHSWIASIPPVDARGALAWSSNIYMFHMAILLGNTNYVPNGPLVFPDPHATYQLMRSYYSQFGLGTLTQVDYPREEIGFMGGTDQSGTILDFAIGQFDNYNAMQMNQYVSTIANGGNRLKPRFVIEALDHDSKQSVYENQVKILNTLDDPDALTVIQEGMRQYISTGQGYAPAGENFATAAKSGTAQDYAPDGTYVQNSTYIAYAPYENPQIAISCIAPYSILDADSVGHRNPCGGATHDILAYFMNRAQ